MNKNIFNIRLFGSYARGDYNEQSDYDILVILKNRNKNISFEMKKFYPFEYDEKLSISYYSINRIKEMYDTGHLFAWHLYQESVNLYPKEFDPLKEIGKPKPKHNEINEIEYFIKIMESCLTQLFENPQNIIYELGLLYICCRNIGLLVSSITNQKFLNFSSFSPFYIKILKFPISEEEYQIFLKARYSSMRGLEPPSITNNSIIKTAQKIFEWSHNLLSILKEKKNGRT